jgi:hypothetical protein
MASRPARSSRTASVRGPKAGSRRAGLEFMHEISVKAIRAGQARLEAAAAE